MKELISIVVPIYNVEKYLNKCVDSILNQTYSKLEIILVDDGSPDRCGDICDEYAKKDKRIKVIHKENGGLSDARNIGIESALGKYICFIDSDDYIEEKFVEILYTNMKEYNAQISIVGYKLISEEYKLNTPLNNINDPKIMNSDEKIKSLFIKNKIGNYAWNKMYKINLFEKIRYPKGKKMEDLGTTYKLFELCDKIVYSNIEMYYYLQRNNSILHSTDSKLCNDKFELAYERYCDIKNINPNLIENYEFMFINSLRLFPFLNNSNMKIAKEILKNKPKTIKMSKGNKIRYLLYKLSKKIYKYLFLKRGIIE